MEAKQLLRSSLFGSPVSIVVHKFEHSYIRCAYLNAHLVQVLYVPYVYIYIARKLRRIHKVVFLEGYLGCPLLKAQVQYVPSSQTDISIYERAL